MKSILLTTSLKEKIATVSIFNIVCLGLLWLYIGIYPSIQGQSEAYNKIIKSMSPSVLKAFGASSSSLNSLSGFLASKQFGFTWPLIIIFLAVIFAVSMIAGEIEQTTISQWLAAPITRLNIYWSKFIAGVLLIVVSVAISVLAIIPLSRFYNLSINSKYVAFTALIGGLFALTIFAFSMLVSTLVSKKSKAYLPIGIIIILMFTLNVVAALNGNLDYLKYLSFFYYFNASDLLSSGSINSASYLMFGAVIVVGSLVGAYVFKKRKYII
jgi:ABC-2 type transport system permease protein